MKKIILLVLLPFASFSQGIQLKLLPTSASVNANTYFVAQQFSGGSFGNGLKVPASQIASYISGLSGVSSFNGRTGAVSLLSSDISTALGYVPEKTLTFNSPLNRTTGTIISFDYSFAGNFTAIQSFTQGIHISSVTPAPTTPSTGVHLWSAGNNTLSILGTNGFSWNVLSNNITGNRVLNPPDHNCIIDNITTSTTSNLTGLLKGNGANVSSVAAPSGTIVGTTDVQTITNKWIQARDGTTASSATPTINTDNLDQYRITALAANITSMTTNLSGTPVQGQVLVLEFTDNGTARTIAWGSGFEDGYINALPLTTDGASSLIGVVLKWNSATSKWRCAGLY